MNLLVQCLDQHQSIGYPDPGLLPMRWILALVWVISLAFLPVIENFTHSDLQSFQVFGARKILQHLSPHMN